MSQDPGPRLRDILEQTALVRAWTEGMTLEAFAGDPRTRYAVQMAFLIMGEAADALPPDLRRRHPEVRWRGLADVADTLRHQDWAVEHRITWAGLENELAPLEEAARAELARLAGPTSDLGPPENGA